VTLALLHINLRSLSNFANIDALVALDALDANIEAQNFIFTS